MYSSLILTDLSLSLCLFLPLIQGLRQITIKNLISTDISRKKSYFWEKPPYLSEMNKIRRLSLNHIDFIVQKVYNNISIFVK